MRLVSEDAAAFQRLSAFKKEDRRGALYQTALKKSARVPLEVCELSEKLLGLGRQEMPRTSRWLKSDLIEAIWFLRSGFFGGRLNVEANLSLLRSPTAARPIRNRLRGLEKNVQKFQGRFD